MCVCVWGGGGGGGGGWGKTEKDKRNVGSKVRTELGGLLSTSPVAVPANLTYMYQYSHTPASQLFLPCGICYTLKTIETHVDTFIQANSFRLVIREVPNR